MQNKKPSVGGVWIFPGTAHLNVRITVPDLFNFLQSVECDIIYELARFTGQRGYHYCLFHSPLDTNSRSVTKKLSESNGLTSPRKE